ncbi:MAG: pimeloyl-ACP methyl ester esterase BioH [Methylococcaceae bacterium]
MARLFMRVMGQGKTLVLVHGWAMHSDCWGEFAEQLARQYRVVCIDLAGHGRSEPLPDFTLESVSEQLIQAIPEPCYWLGWSLGASVVLEIARRYPERVKALILLAGNPYFHSAAKDDWLGVDSQILEHFAGQLQAKPQATLLKFLSLQVLGLPHYKSLLPILKQMVATHPVPSEQTLQQGLNILKNNDLRPVVASLNMPAMLILGEKDTLVPVGVGALMQQLQPNLQVHIIKKAGHIPFLSHPQELLTLVNDFMGVKQF